LCALLLLSCKKETASDAANKAHREAERTAAILESPDRDEWQKPDAVVEALRLKNGDVVADIGAGTGYFARRFAEKVAPKGVSIGYDINATMVEYMQRDANARHLVDSYKAHLIGSHNPVLEDNYYDLIFFCNTYQHLENRISYFKSLKKSLKKNGRIVVIDFETLDKTDEESGEVPENLVDKKVVINEFKKAGFTLKQDRNFLPSQYFLEFTRK
ncbi:MAG TPA: methyltransferase domain-containing protein, partial [Turneriella sp.]|nr:methyltransferase domain-containing protein [Turneriella sp.]